MSEGGIGGLSTRTATTGYPFGGKMMMLVLFVLY